MMRIRECVGSQWFRGPYFNVSFPIEEATADIRWKASINVRINNQFIGFLGNLLSQRVFLEQFYFFAFM